MTNQNNKLHSETSPYLLQHADNPVNWHPWNEQALDLARSQNKPILLSIGYSACHWCHVMAHESFEDIKTATIMNKYFINIKVDREERPDLDKIYQTAHSLLTSRPGGWPLTVFLSPHNQMPFFAGTYFPDSPRHNLPSFSEIMSLVASAYTNKQDEIKQQEISIKHILNDASTHSLIDTPLTSLPLDLARRQLKNAFDAKNGGFSMAPKFPHPDMINRCLRQYLFLQSQGKHDSEALHMATYTLDKMAIGGFFDQLGGGFFRYSTDDHWMIPHFEKMLYDNAQLLTLYSQAYALTHNVIYKQVITLTAGWTISEMQTPEGGYCSALDADTDGKEGKTYCWTAKDIQALVTDDEFKALKQKYKLTGKANFDGHWHLHNHEPIAEVAKKLKLDISSVSTLIDSAHHKLLTERNKRSQPGRDDKILCSWNALMIHAMAQAGRRTNTLTYSNSAFKAADFIYSTLWKNQRLLASYKDGKSHLNAYLDDYAYLLQAIIECLQSKWSLRYYDWAIDIADSLLNFFEDKEQGGFYFTSHDHEQLLYRSKTFSDDAMPNGNAVAAYALYQLGLLSGQTKYLDSAEKTLRCAYNDLNEQAITHCSLLHALEIYLTTGIVIILRGNNALINQWQQLANNCTSPRLICIAISNTDTLPESLADKKEQGEICAYICEGTSCLPPITDLTEFNHYIIGMTHHDNH